MRVINTVKVSLLGSLFAFAAAGPSIAAEHQVFTTFNAIASSHDGQRSWLNGGLGRFAGGDANSGQNNSITGETHVGYDYKNGPWLLRGHIRGRLSNESNGGRKAGLVELKLRYSQQFDPQNRLSYSVGQFFLPSSLENTERFWDSPYTIHYSSLNSWLGEEFRPIGFDFNWQHQTDTGARWNLGASAYRSNDSFGALIAWRGWSIGRRRSVYGEALPLPDLQGFTDTGTFSEQREQSKPFGKDLDGRWGYALRAQWQLPGKGKIRFNYIDNRGDKGLHNGEYAWHTKMGIVGAKWQLTDQFELLGEYSAGTTGMGVPGIAAANINFYSAYIMASYRTAAWRYSFRYDEFGNNDIDNAIDDPNDDSGHSFTAAIIYQGLDSPWRLALELLRNQGRRQRITPQGIDNLDAATQLSLLTRYVF